MAKGIIYLMSTAVPGLIKIGKTTMANYSQRMYNLESNGYRNVSLLKWKGTMKKNCFCILFLRRAV